MRSLDFPGLVLAVLCAAAALAARGILPEALLAWCAGPALLCAAALPLLSRWSPLVPSSFKLTLVTLSLSPPLAALVWGAWHLLLGPRAALCACAASFALLHLASLRRSVRCDPLTRATSLVVGASLALGVAVAAALLRGNDPRIAEPGMLRAALALAVERSLPPLHPWLAGEAWTAAWSADLLASFCMHALGIAATQAHALMAVFGAFLLPGWLFLLAESVWADARRSAIAVALCLCASLGFAAAGDAPFAALGCYLLAGPAGLALSFTLAGMACAGHALRHGRRPWVGLCALFLGTALLLDFSSTWPGVLAVALAALAPACDVQARPRVLLALAACTLPALAQARLLLPAAAALDLTISDRGLAAAGAWSVCGALAAGLHWRGLAGPRRALLLLCLLACVLSLLALWFEPPLTSVRGAAGLGLVTAAILAAGNFALDGAGRLRALARLATLGLALAGVPVLVAEFASAWTAAGRDDALLGESARALEPVGHEASSKDLRAALAALRSDERLRADRAVLLACPAQNPYRKTRDLPEGGLAACAGLALFGDTRLPVMLGEVQFQPRLEQLLQLFRHPAEFDPTLFERLRAMGSGAAVCLLREEDRAINPALVGKLERMGFVHWQSFGEVWLFLGPLAVASRYKEKP